jgi:hypothetical protein
VLAKQSDGFRCAQPDRDDVLVLREFWKFALSNLRGACKWKVKKSATLYFMPMFAICGTGHLSEISIKLAKYALLYAFISRLYR